MQACQLPLFLKAMASKEEETSQEKEVKHVPDVVRSIKRSASFDEEEEEEEVSDDDSDNIPDELSKARKEKRLAMNRASARTRRKRKKVLLESLTNEVTNLTKANQTLQDANDTLRGRVEQLEAALGQAQATIASTLTASVSARVQPRYGLMEQNQEDVLRSLLLGGSAPAMNQSVLGNQLLNAQAAQLFGQQAGARGLLYNAYQANQEALGAQQSFSVPSNANLPKWVG